MASATFHTIIIEWPNQSGPKFKERLSAVATIIPGHLVEIDAASALILESSGDGTTPVPALVALEVPTVSDTGTQAIDAAYASGDTVRYIRPPGGAELLMWLADSNNVADGDPLGSDGAGGLQLLVPSGSVDNVVIAYAAEDLNNATGAQARIRAEIA